MLKVFPLHDRVGDNRGVVGRSLVDDKEIAVELRPTVDYTDFEIFEPFGD